MYPCGSKKLNKTLSVQKILQINPKDNVVVALTDLPKGSTIEINDETIVLGAGIQSKHKAAVKDLQTGEEVIMYGVLVGRAMQPIAKGDAITTQNIQHASNENYRKSNQ